jgi:hypothetical protein
MEKALDLENDVIKVALMTSSYTPDKDTNTFDNTYEVSGSGYVAGGATLASKIVTQDDTDDSAYWDAEDVTWANSTITARYAVLYDTTVSDTIIGVVDFGEDKSTTGEDFLIQWDEDGILSALQG